MESVVREWSWFLAKFYRLPGMGYHFLDLWTKKPIISGFSEQRLDF